MTGCFDFFLVNLSVLNILNEWKKLDTKTLDTKEYNKIWRI